MIEKLASVFNCKLVDYLHHHVRKKKKRDEMKKEREM